MSEPVLFNPETDVHLVPQFVRILIDCIEQEPYLSAAFLKPLDPVAIEKWFHSLVQAIAKGGRKLFVQSAPNPSTGEEEVAGIVMLILPVSETGPFRAYIDKLLVAPEHRRQGVARRLMNALEATAKEMGRTLLLLDTETDSPAEYMYLVLGYTKVGVVPGYLLSPNDRALKAGTFFYKDLTAGA